MLVRRSEKPQNSGAVAANRVPLATLPRREIPALNDSTPSAAPSTRWHPAPDGAFGVLGETLEIARRHWAKLATLYLMLLAPLWIVQALLAIDAGIADAVLAVVTGIIYYFASFLPGIGATILTGDAVVGERTSVARIWTITWRDAFDIVVLGCLAGLALVAGFLCLIVPGFVFLAALAVVGPALVIERLTPTDAMRRSWELTRGSRWRIFFQLFVVWLGLGVVDGAFTMVVGDENAVASLVELLLTLARSTILGVFAAVCYVDLRARTGVDADVFATELERAKTAPPRT